MFCGQVLVHMGSDFTCEAGHSKSADSLSSSVGLIVSRGFLEVGFPLTD